MARSPIDLTLIELENLEGNDIRLPRFDSVIAWEIGLHAHQLAQQFDSALIIDITLPNGQVLFHSPSKNGGVLDNDFWVSRKKKTVLRFGKSSYYMGRKAATKASTVEDALFVDKQEYATHGGSVPIRVESSDLLCGALTVSGLPHDQDHLFALQVLKEMKAKIK